MHASVWSSSPHKLTPLQPLAFAHGEHAPLHHTKRSFTPHIAGIHAYTTAAEVGVYVYWHLMLDLTMEGLQPWKRKWLEAVADTRAAIRTVSPEHIKFASASLPLSSITEYTIWARKTFDPSSAPPGVSERGSPPMLHDLI
jgi:hypothetical protein